MKFVDDQWFETITCGKCGIAWAMPTAFVNARRSDGKSFYCPNGDSRVYRQTTEDELRKELARKVEMLASAEERAEKAESERRSISKAHTKMRERVMNGVCPCCNRTFQNLMQHMKSEHPDFAEVRNLFALRKAFGMTQADVAREAGVDATHVSLYERDRHVAPYVKHRLDQWVEGHHIASAHQTDGQS